LNPRVLPTEPRYYRLNPKVLPNEPQGITG